MDKRSEENQRDAIAVLRIHVQYWDSEPHSPELTKQVRGSAVAMETQCLATGLKPPGQPKATRKATG